MNAYNKLLLILMVIVSVVTVQSEMVWGVPQLCTSVENDYKDRRINNVRPYHNRAASIRYDPSLICNQNALCETLPGTFAYVYGQVGIYYRNTDLSLPVFVPLSVKEAALSKEGKYMIPKWDGKIFWMKINPNKAPIGLQPFYLDDDTSCSGCMEFISRSMLYKKNGVDYSGYPYNGVRMYMYIKVDADFRVMSYTIDIFDQDDNLAQRGLTLNIGDQVQMLYFEDDEDDTSLQWESVSLEDFVLVTQEPVFEYAGYIPGRDFGCTNCAGRIDLPQSDLFFRMVGYVHDAANDVDMPTYSQHTALGKLRDNVCAAYPQLTTKAPTLADVVEGLRILASLAPQHFCFRDVNSDNKFDMAEVVWMLQKIAGLR